MWIFAHRGAAANKRAENTIAAFRAARARGAHLESDARFSRDRKVVLVHDAWFRVGWIPLPVRWQRAARLARAGVATIDDFYDALGTDAEVSIDLKVTDTGSALVDAASRRGAVGRLWLVSDRIDVLVALRTSTAQVRLVHEARQRSIDDVGAHARLLADASIDAMNSDALTWEPGVAEQVHACGVLAFGSLANDRERFVAALERGLDAIYTDDIGMAQDVLGR